MFTSLSIRNFRCFNEQLCFESIPLDRVNLIAGTE